MLSTRFKFLYSGLSECGYVRPTNEDEWRVLEDLGCFMVADGIGGHQAGEVASHLAISHLAEQLEILSLDRQEDLNVAKENFQRAFSLTNQYVHTMGQSRRDWNKMGATLTVAMLLKQGVLFGHVGDSSLFHLSAGKIKQLSTPHVKYQSKRSMLTRAIGIQERVSAQIGFIPLTNKDRLLLCTDGVTCYLPTEEIRQSLISESTVEAVCKNLCSRALEMGGGDNITLICVEVEDDLLRS